ncbi:protein transport protein SFT2-like [Populus alba x Populus x berolinensis]|uniref:Vesicle transport protein n=1 Tax=Populus alba x Populus x berolinensis TaxID=444605 RepID=A0AAD6LUS8_9ROSI|nr:protein transport protein SFT2-like [Populus alba x Populus x berolinensis]
MQKTAQSWFTGGPTFNDQKSSSSSSSSPSLLSDWNAYAASQESDSSAPAFDLEAAVRTTSDKVSGTFNVVSKGVRDIPGSFQSSTINVPSGQSFVYFGILLAAGVFFVFIAFTMFLPVMVLVPQKFAICFTIGCALIVASFFALKGPKNQLAHMFSKEAPCFPSYLQRLPFTLGFISTMVGTVYVSMVLHSYILSVLFSVLQVLALSYYAISYFPGGSTGLKFLSSTFTASILRCFGR